MKGWGFSCLIFCAAVCGGEEVVWLEPVTVVAPSQADLDLLAVSTASDVSIITREQIENSGAASAPELLQEKANVLIRSSTGTPMDGQVSMRGFGENSHLRTLVLVDGHKMNQADMSGISWIEFPPMSIESIEVIRGAQCVLYGNHAAGGVIQIRTRRGEEAGFYAGGTAGSFGYVQGGAGYGGSAGDVDYYAGVNAFQTDGFRSNSAARATVVSGGIGWFVTPADTFSIRASASESEQSYPGSITYEQLQEDPAYSSNDGTEGAESRSALATAIWSSHRSWGSYRMASGGSVREGEWHIGTTYAENDTVGISLAPRIKWGDDDRHLIAGVDLFYDELDFTDLHPDNTDYAQARAYLDRTTVSPYLFMQHAFERPYKVSGGVRYETVRTDNRYDDYVDDQILPTEELWGVGSYANPDFKSSPDLDPANSYTGVIKKEGWAAELALIREFGGSGSVWLGYDRLYRYPTLDETASYQGYVLSDPLNENLDPETGSNFEAGGRFFADYWKGSLVGFCLLMDDEIAYVETDSVKLNMNIGETVRWGAEAELSYERAVWGASARWSLVRARFTGGADKGNTVPLVPWANGICSAWVDPADFLRLTAELSYVSEQYQGGDTANELRKMDDYALFGLRANFRLSNAADLILSIDNVTDAVYASSAYYGGFYPGAGRSFRVGFNLRY